MVLDLRELIGGVVPAVPFSFAMSASGLSDDLQDGSVQVNGRVENHAGFMQLDGMATLEGQFRCGRCCTVFSQKLEFPMAYRLAEKLDGKDEEEFLLLEDGMLDVSEVTRTQLLTEMPYRFLCKEDCKGLCPKCGCDLNVERCSCDTREVDPRWAALSSFFDE